MLQDFKELLSIFNSLSVKYLVVGGYAVSLHAQPRATKNIDIFFKSDAENAKLVYAALAKFGAPLGGMSIEDFWDRSKFFRIGSPPAMVDLLPEISGMDFEKAWQGRVEAVIDKASGLTAFFISKEDLIAAKLAAGRPQYLADVAALQQSGKAERPPG